MVRKKWNIIPYDKNKASYLAALTEEDDFAVLLLQSRGFSEPSEIKSFLSTPEPKLSSPFLLADMDKAVERIFRAIENDEKILVYGDYDADGVTATALLYSHLETMGANVSYYIPSRITEGYGLSESVVQKIVSQEIDLVITVDNGIAAVNEAIALKENGIDLIITDHHQPGPVLPEAIAVINPHREDDASPEKNLAGVGVALKLVAALEDGDYFSVIEDYGDIAAIGTIADIVPLTGENRTIAKLGLKYLENTYRPGIRALLDSQNFSGKPANAASVSFVIAPKINAAGRMGSAYTALKLLLTDDDDEAHELLSEIQTANSLRQNAELDILNEIEADFDKNPLKRLDRVIVAKGHNWHLGVIGIAAARLVDKYGKPAVVISIGDDGVSKGSGRSIDGFSLYDALSAVSDSLLQFGGHTLAAGFSIQEENIDVFREKINSYAKDNGDIYPVLNIDCRLNPANINTSILYSLSLLEPFGAKNPAPLFGLLNMKITGIKSIGGNKHLRITLARDKISVPTVYFGQCINSFPYCEGDTVDAAVKIEKNEYMGETRLSIQIKDIRPSQDDDSGLFKSMCIYESLKRGETLSKEQKTMICPNRELITKVFKYIREQKSFSASPEIICFRTGHDSKFTGAVCVCLDALCDAGILQKDKNEYKLTNFSGKADLNACEILRKIGYTG